MIFLMEAKTSGIASRLNAGKSGIFIIFFFFHNIDGIYRRAPKSGEGIWLKPKEQSSGFILGMKSEAVHELCQLRS